MKIVEKNYIKGFKEYYYYKSDLEKFSTSELIDILRSLRCKESRYLEYQDETSGVIWKIISQVIGLCLIGVNIINLLL